MVRRIHWLTWRSACPPCLSTRTDNLDNARGTFGWTFAIARASALVLHVDIAMLLIPVCRNFITLIRRTYLNSLIPFDAKWVVMHLVLIPARGTD